MCLYIYTIPLLFHDLYIVVCIDRFSSGYRFDLTFSEKGFYYRCTFYGWRVYMISISCFVFSFQRIMGLKKKKKKPSNFYCLYMFLTYYCVLKTVFALTPNCLSYVCLDRKKRLCLSVLFYNLPYSSYSMPLIVSREVRSDRC